MPRTTTVAAFDFDGTLSTHDCVVPFMRKVAGTPRFVARLAARPLPLIAALARRDRDAVKELATRAAFGGRSAADVDAVGRVFAAQVVAGGVRSDTVERLRAHLDDGDTVVIVSASLQPYLDPVGAALGAHGVLCTRLAVDDDGVLTGALEGENCRAEEKVRRLSSWLTAEHLARENVHLVVYGDSVGDHALLAEADSGFWAARRTLAAWRSP
ncbi:MAG: HAD-IB family hydrolase [Actinomycetota bacterium]|nr:HAD-IB family hydrolase [Actinomycetota bacterium]